MIHEEKNFDIDEIKLILDKVYGFIDIEKSGRINIFFNPADDTFKLSFLGLNKSAVDDICHNIDHISDTALKHDNIDCVYCEKLDNILVLRRNK